MSNIRIYKMSDGAEIIGTVLDETNTNFILIEKIRVIQVQHNHETRQASVGITWPWSALGDQEMEISRGHIVSTIRNVPKQFEDIYLQNTSGIQLVP